MIVTENKIINGADILNDTTETKTKQPFNSALSNSEEERDIMELDKDIVFECHRIAPMEKRLTEYIEYRFQDKYLVRGKKSGKECWQYVLLDPLKRKSFKEETEKDDCCSLDVADYGKILKSGWGENPPQDVKDELDCFPERISHDLWITGEEFGNTCFYYYLLIAYDKRVMLDEKSVTTAKDVEQSCYGVLYSGWGIDPPESISDTIINTFFCTEDWLVEDKIPDLNVRDSGTIHKAARDGELETLKGLVAKKIDVNSADQNGWTPLHHAAYGGNLDAVKYLTDCGANINVKDKVCGRMPLHIAAREGHTDVVEFFLNKRSFLFKRIIDINGVDEMNWTPLHYAAWSCHLNAVKLLIKKGADIQAKEATRGKKPLHTCAERGRGYLDILQLFLKSGNGVDDTDEEGRTSLYYAAQKGHADVVLYLLDDTKANIHAETIYGSKPIHAASTGCKTFVIHLLLKHGAKVNDLTKNKFTPLHFAAQDGQLEVVKYLIKNGANVEARTNSDRKPSDIARLNGHMEVVDVLDGMK